MTDGTIQWLNGQKGVWALCLEDGAGGLVYYSATHSDDFKILKQSDRIPPDLEHGQNGPAAENVTVT